MGRAASMKPYLRIKKFGAFRRRSTIFGSHIAAQRIFEDCEEELEFTAGSTSANYPVVVLARQQRIVLVRCRSLPVSIPSLASRARIDLSPHLFLVGRSPGPARTASS